MSRKFNNIPYIPDYQWVRKQMEEDLKYRLEDREERTSLGRPLYYRINVQIIMTQECPYNCDFCLERKHPMTGQFDADKQIESLIGVLKEHPNARLTITGGEPGLYPEHVKRLIEVYKRNSNNVFCSINTAGYSTELNGLANINLSVNEYVKPNPNNFPGCTLQTVLEDKDMTLEAIKNIMDSYENTKRFSFRFLSGIVKHTYNVKIFNELRMDRSIDVSTFRVGDFFTYCTFNYKDKHARVTLGDMYQQMNNNYEDGYSNIIIHPDGRVGINWS